MLKHVVHSIFVTLFSMQLVFGTLADIKEYTNLFEHYELHNSQFGDTLYSFLEKHYGKDKAAHTKEHGTHHKVPFDNHSAEHHINQYLASFHFKTAEKLEVLPVYHSKQQIFYTCNCKYWLLANKLLQPPKVL